MPFIPDNHRDKHQDERRKNGEPRKQLLDEEYYRATKLNSDYFSHRFSEGVRAYLEDWALVERSHQQYKSDEGAPCVPLKPRLERFRKIDWERVVLNRKSSRRFSGEKISYTQLSNLLLLSCGLKENGEWLREPGSRTHWPRRALPSGGGLYPLEYYVLALNVAGLPKGLYHLDLLKGGLSFLRNDEKVFKTEEFWAQQWLFNRPAAMIYVSAVFDRSRVKYGDRCLRYIFLEAGGVGTQMNLLAEAMGFDFCFDGGGFEDKIENLIGLNGRSEGLVATFVLGHARG